MTGQPRKHSFPPVVAADTRLLVLGSLPGERSLAERRYYAHPQNQFWRLIGAAVERPDLPALPYDERLLALLAAGVGLWDVVASAIRPGSTDAAIREAAGNDLATLVASLPVLRAVAFNGGTAWRQGAPVLKNSGPDLITLPSSSPLHTIGLAAKLPAWQALRQYLSPGAAHNGNNVSNS
ncbi:DNA-deoxyinosine glycosylase [Sphingomonas aracearum]|uniref:DNA-deoxyinosine glycosylase n=1 Tax=Sphingomonas aracearum TaxID=2283317 RepID=A0A369VYT0_9SPHN|nr:DNA-deoxyinosine glycosylase [Sphingomonas aracearum]RDE06969.1 DNA-deoxyinosine glycosylase [Sphingomonas aracearum]